MLIRRPKALTTHTLSTPIDFSDKVIQTHGEGSDSCERRSSLSNLLALLVEHSLWLTEEYELLMDGGPEGASNDLFGLVIATWDELEVVARQVHGYRDCIFGSGGRCPSTAPVACDACVT